VGELLELGAAPRPGPRRTTGRFAAKCAAHYRQ
jgi:hypothetical protein